MSAPRGRTSRACCAMCALLALLAGCKPRPAPPPESLSDHAERGPIQLTVEVTPRSPWVGDAVDVRLRMHTPAGCSVRFPQAEELGEIGAQATPAAEPTPAADGGLEWAQHYAFVPFQSGAIEIPPLAVKYALPPDGAAAEFSNELVSGTLKLDVRSALTTQDTVASPRDVTDTLALPRRPLSPRDVAAAALPALLLIANAALLIAAIAARARRPAAPIPAGVWAARALADLQRGELLTTGRFREFYYGLSEIVRRYIELQFGLAAPEMTTDEFLRILALEREAVPYDRQRLRDFLEACDIVKYAAFTPTRDAAEAAWHSASAFVHATSAAAARAQAERAAVGAESRPGGGRAA